MHHDYARTYRDIQAEESHSEYYRVEYCFVTGGEDGPKLTVDIDPEDLRMFIDEMIGKGGVKILNVGLKQEV